MTQVHGRHRKSAAGGPQDSGRLESAAVSVGICLGCLLILGLIWAYIISAAAGRAVCYAWRWLGLRGRLAVGMSASLLAALFAAGIDPGAWLPATVAGVAAFGVCGMWRAALWALDKREKHLGQQEWREGHGAAVITGGADPETVGRNSERLDAHDGELDEHDGRLRWLEANLAYLVGGMAGIGRETGLRLPDVESTQPALRAVSGGKAAG